MLETIERTLDAVERGNLTRREATLRLAALVAAVAGAGSLARAEDSPRSTFTSEGLNHIALRVTDVARSRAFYQERLGLRVTSETDRNCFLDCGGNQFVALFRGERAGLDHYCYTVQGYRPDEAVKKLESAGHTPRRTENRVYFEDPDGLTVQVSG